MSFDNSKPPIFGEIRFELPIAPVSQQANAAAKSAVTNEIRSITRLLEYILTGDVKIEIEWLVHEQLRYESDQAPDVDNIIKPLLDGLCGPEGLLRDDCQVQSVSCYWIDWTREDQQIAVRVSYMPDDWLKKKNLFFVQYPKGLCFPVNRDLPHKALNLIVNRVETMLADREELQQLSNDYYFSKTLLPIQRFFHRTRINGFSVVKIDEIRDRANDPV
ncbi:RusA family crossover junction endodeoxyribonuclease [Trichocoleus desertorum AS-A10]|uniref:RusA family crossover junction endodeoxyribonuclease n=1 Tax=Trichocoleus desertorum TaxID=1481672 RepID=UPI003296E185